MVRFKHHSASLSNEDRYHLNRLANEKLVAHWDTTEKIAPRNKWKNNNSKF